MKIRYIILTIYLLVLSSCVLMLVTLSKYSSSVNPEPNFPIGDRLHFNYTRGDLYRNDTLIIGVPSSYEENGEIVSCIETMNVIPGDRIVYYFYITNYDSEIENNIPGLFYAVANGLLSLPVKQSTFDIECRVEYREVSENEDTNEITTPFIQLTDNLSLPKASKSHVKYEFRVTAYLDGQIENTVSDDYFGATLRLNLYFNAASQ